MSDIGEALGTAVEGGLFAKAVGRNTSADKDGNPLDGGHFGEGACLNCGTVLIGAHCHACGQKAHLHRTIRAFLHDLLHGALHFDGKTWRTLPLLALRPGKLTRRYIEGERARFVSPMALFLFTIFLMFAIFQLAGISTPTDISGDAAAQWRQVAENEVERLEAKQVELEQELAEDGLDDTQRQQKQAELDQVNRQLDGIEQAEADLPFLKGLTGDSGETTESTVAGVPVETAPDGTTSIPLSVDGDATMKVGTSGVAWVDAALKKWRTNPGLMLYKLQTNFYKFSWLLIPLSIPFVWLLFVWKRRFKAYDHAIFVTYSLSFMTLLIITVTVLGLLALPSWIVILAMLLVPPLHIYKHLRGAYEIGRLSAIWRLVVLLGFILLILVVFLQLLILIGAF